MEKGKLKINTAAAATTLDCKKIDIKSKASLSLGEVTIEKEEKSKEQDGLIV